MILKLVQYQLGVRVISRIDDFLGPLHEGIWEITIPKSSVTEPLGPGWERSLLNIPSPGTLASYRKGHYHIHEKQTAFSVHLDRYDPKTHPFLHLVDDAPLLLMIADTFTALVASARKSAEIKTGLLLKEQKRTWQILIMVGFALFLVATWIILNPLLTFGGILRIMVPLLIMVLGIIISRKGISPDFTGIVSRGSLFIGVSVFLMGIVSFYLPLDIFVQIVLLVLSFWAFGSAWMSFSQVARGKDSVPEGFYRRLMTGIFSLLLALLILLIPDAMVALLMEIFGILVLLLGIVLCAGGWRLRVKMNTEARE